MLKGESGGVTDAGHQSQENNFNKFCYLCISLLFSTDPEVYMGGYTPIKEVSSHEMKLNTSFKPEIDKDKIFGHLLL